MKLYKKTFLTILLLLFSVTLRTAVVYIDGWASGKIISIKNNDAYLLTETDKKIIYLSLDPQQVQNCWIDNIVTMC
jgi:hypothetical protein